MADVTAEQSAQTYLNEARILIKQRKLEPARLALESASQQSGISPELLLAIGDAWNDIADANRARSFWLATVSRATAPSIRSKANRRLANDALGRNRPADAVRFFEQLLNDRPDDRPALLRLLGLRFSSASRDDRVQIFKDLSTRFPVLRNEYTEAAFVLPFTDPDRALAILERDFGAVISERDLAVRAVDSFIEAASPDHAFRLAERIFQAPRAAGRELSCMLRAEKAVGRHPSLALSHYDAHLARYPDDHDRRIKKARLLLQLRRWSAVCEETERVRGANPRHIGAAELEIQALIRLDKPMAAQALREEIENLHNIDGGAVSGALAVLDLAIANGKSNLDRGTNLNELGGTSEMRVDVLMAKGHYAEALSLIRSLMHYSDDMKLRSKGIQCAAALASCEGLPTSFPEAAFMTAIAQRRPSPPGPPRSVVLVTSTLGAGGAERQISLSAGQIAAPLAAIGLDVHLICRDLRPEYDNHLMLPMLEGTCVNVVDLSHRDAGLVVRALRAAGDLNREDVQLLSAFPLPLYRTIILLYEQFRLLRPEVVYLWQDGIICAGSAAAALAGVPRIVCSIRNVVPLEYDIRRMRPYLKGVYKSLQARPNVSLTANSMMGARDYEAKFGLAPGSIAVIRNGLEMDAVMQRAGSEGRVRTRSELGWALDDLVLGAVFRLVPAKRPHRWLEVAARVAAELPRLKMLVVGDGPLHAELVAYADQLGIGDRTVFAGRRTPVEPWIAAMDTMLLSSDVEGLPNVLIEAQALGVPVVTTDAGGAREAVEDGVTGLVVSENNAELLAKACLKMLTDDRARVTAQTEAPRAINERFGIERMKRETLVALGFEDRFPILS